MLKKLLSPKKHPYQEALHILLYEYPQGLSAIDIADQLNISDVACNALLKSEQIRDAIDADPYTGTLIYTSKRKTRPQFSLAKAVAQGQQNQSIAIMKVVGLSCSLLAGVTLIVAQLPDISINIVTAENQSWKPENDWESNLHHKLNLSFTEQELIERQKLQLAVEREDLSARMNQMRTAAIQKNCSSYWINNRYCYLEGRLFSKSDFDQELRSMRAEIREIDRQYRLLGSR